MRSVAQSGRECVGAVGGGRSVAVLAAQSPARSPRTRTQSSGSSVLSRVSQTGRHLRRTRTGRQTLHLEQSTRIARFRTVRRPTRMGGWRSFTKRGKGGGRE